jgi:putative membrane protein
VFDLGAKLHVTPAASDTATSLKKQAALHGAAFDKVYVDNEVDYHKDVVNAVTTVLIPNARNGELKAALQGVAPLFQGHLEHGEMVQKDLSK